MAVTVGELIEGLKGLDPDLLVVLASDEEGNSFKTMDEAMSRGVFYDDGPSAGEFIGEDGDDEDGYESSSDFDDEDEDGYEDVDLDVNAQPAVVFWPVG